MIDRESVENRDLSTVMHLVQRLTSSKDFALHCQEKIQFGFAAYDYDPRKLFEIGEVRWYVAVLDHNFNELFFFAPHDESAITLRLFIYCIAGIGWENDQGSPGFPRNIIIDQEMLTPFLERHFTYLNHICEWLGLRTESGT